MSNREFLNGHIGLQYNCNVDKNVRDFFQKYVGLTIYKEYYASIAKPGFAFYFKAHGTLISCETEG